MENIVLLDGERLEPLGNGIRVIVSEEHKFWTDTVLLAHFASPDRQCTACDLGSGCGTIPLIWLRRNLTNHVDAVEIQDNACSMLERSIVLNQLTDRIRVCHRDLRELKGVLPMSAYDLVVCNPPYKASGTGIVSKEQSHIIARHESLCTIDDIMAAAQGLLRFSGRLCMCQRPERLADVMLSMRQHNIEPKRLRFVQQRPNKAPKLFLIEGRRSGRPGGLKVEPVLLIEGEKGGFSEEMLEIYGEYKEGYV